MLPVFLSLLILTCGAHVAHSTRHGQPVSMQGYDLCFSGNSIFTCEINSFTDEEHIEAAGHVSPISLPAGCTTGICSWSTGPCVFDSDSNNIVSWGTGSADFNSGTCHQNNGVSSGSPSYYYYDGFTCSLDTWETPLLTPFPYELVSTTKSVGFFLR